MENRHTKEELVLAVGLPLEVALGGASHEVLVRIVQQHSIGIHHEHVVTVTDNGLYHCGLDAHDPLPRLLRIFALWLELHVLSLQQSL